ncbi:phosphoribosylanthranilate isomerase [Methylobacterium iners]|uniref:N-(5'-phosphoribosyl)anthranilate isomerase n=1 Tax=Methylobacterium iners TaxID=418707 RepID=A0ABQ4S0H5_9HYPH|nr:phosphoribosylanthranilate isomerase [Methylobacterium iners]GJD95358.1 N-(5'-phosphoribosyl)anthranilate isomerase [Methylobacterium iners]
MPSVHVKICGLSTAATLDAALSSGAELVGFVHFARSPRHVSFEDGRLLSQQARGRAERVVLLVDPDDETVASACEALDPDWVQLHGSEPPARVAAIRAASGRHVMKALGIASRADLETVATYTGVADRLLLDAKPPAGAALPGGNGTAFDWTLLTGAGLPSTYMLSGGLTPSNVSRALAVTGASAVDVSSGVETRPGLKDPERIAAFVGAVRAQPR